MTSVETLGYSQTALRDEDAAAPALTFTALLLAGGLSRRMGTDKATLLVDGEPLWSRQIRLLRELKPQAVWVSARASPSWLPPDIRFVADQPPSRGPLSGLAAALERIETTHLIALAADLPKMDAAHLRKLIAHTGPGCGVVPWNEEYFEPLCAVYPMKAAEIAGSLCAGEDVSLQNFVRTLVEARLVQPLALAPWEKPFYANLNTPADLSALSGNTPARCPPST